MSRPGIVAMPLTCIYARHAWIRRDSFKTSMAEYRSGYRTPIFPGQAIQDSCTLRLQVQREAVPFPGNHRFPGDPSSTRACSASPGPHSSG